MRANAVERSRVDPTPLCTRRIDPPAREQGYPRQGTNMVTNPSENIVTNPRAITSSTTAAAARADRQALCSKAAAFAVGGYSHASDARNPGALKYPGSRNFPGLRQKKQICPYWAFPTGARAPAPLLEEVKI